MSIAPHQRDTPNPGRGDRSPRLAIVDAPPDTPAQDHTGAGQRAASRRGPLLAVCGLCGGAGASTLTYLVGRYVASDRDGPVLVCDTGGPGGGLAAYAQVSAPRSLIELAAVVAAGLPAGRPYATTKDGLRVLATGPRFTARSPVDGVETVLEHARAAHALSVVDCGTLDREAEQVALGKATHIAWVLPATRTGVDRAERVLGAINPYLLGRQLVIARRDERDTKAPMNRLKALAQQRGGPLILVPHLPDLLDARPAAALETAQVPLQAILGVLDR